MKLPVIQNAFENVKKFSQEKLVEEYPNGVPEAIRKRYLQELTFLESSDYIDDFEILLVCLFAVQFSPLLLLVT